jgi:hypothetical protein
MSLDQRLVDSLATYADGVDMTSTDLDRMQRDLYERLNRPHRPRWTRLVLAAAAVLLLIAAVAASALWLRKPDTSVPANDGAGTAPPPGLYLFDNGLARNIAGIHADGTERDFTSAQNLVDPLLPVPISQWQMDGDNFLFDSRNEQGQLCRGTSRIHPQPDGRVAYDAGTISGPDCPTAGESFEALTSTRLSPESEAGRAITPSAGEPVSPVTAPVQLEGIWLVQGSGIVVGVDEKPDAGAKYVLDSRGEVDRTPEVRGNLQATTDGRIVLTSPGCGDTVLDHANVRGTPKLANTGGGEFGLSVTATVTADPCNRFGGRNVVTWIRVL